MLGVGFAGTAKACCVENSTIVSVKQRIFFMFFFSVQLNRKDTKFFGHNKTIFKDKKKPKNFVNRKILIIFAD
jgi:hypothetical protein